MPNFSIIRSCFTSGILFTAFLHSSVATAYESNQGADKRPELTLINGRVANPAEFPATFIANMNGGRCTGSVIGPRTFLLAAHCVGDGQTASFTKDNQRYSFTCYHSDFYRRDRQNMDHDVALCYRSDAIEGIPFENITTDPQYTQVGDQLLLGGFGCQRSGGGLDNNYRIGFSPIIRTPRPPYSYDIVTERGGALCQGDSGGPAYRYIDADKKYRYVVSANSKGDIKTTSYLASLATQTSVNFINEFRNRFNAKICGVDTDVKGCRSMGDTNKDNDDSGDDNDDWDSNIPENLAQTCTKALEEKAFSIWKSCLIYAKGTLSACDKANDQLQRCYSER